MASATEQVDLFLDQYVPIRQWSRPAVLPEVWLVERAADGREMLLKRWKSPASNSSQLQLERALWDAELRRLLHLSSLSAAHRYLTTLHDAKVHDDWFWMLLEAPGAWPLRQLMSNRSQGWLKDKESRAVREGLWQGLLRLARGLGLLHQQQLVHRNLSADVVFVGPNDGPSSFRLSGFERSYGLRQSPSSFRSQMNDGDPWASFAEDFRQLGRLATELLVLDKALGVGGPSEDAPLLAKIDQALWLTIRERELLKQLLDPDPMTRLSRLELALPWFLQVLEELAPQRVGSDYLALEVRWQTQRVLDPGIESLGAAVQKILAEQKSDTDADGSSVRREFVERDLIDAQLFRKTSASGVSEHFLVGRQLTYLLLPGVPRPSEDEWLLPRCDSVKPFVSGDAQIDRVNLRKPIKVYEYWQVRENRDSVVRGAFSWSRLAVEESSELPPSLRRFHDMLRFTNQIDLVFRDAEIFAYEQVGDATSAQYELLAIVELPRDPSPPEWALGGRRPTERLVAYIEELQKDQQDVELFLGPSESLVIQSAREQLERVTWEVIVDPERSCKALHAQVSTEFPQAVYLKRRIAKDLPEPPQKGFVRSPDHYGQLSLIRRRSQAIERLAEQHHLLRILREPKTIDLGPHASEESSSEEGLDAAKKRALAAVWRTRPLFVLQGPPGTGKTHFVAKLLARLFREDPLARVLVSAQAHAAVDVLRDRIQDEIQGSQQGQEQKPPVPPPLLVRAERRYSRRTGSQAGQQAAFQTGDPYYPLPCAEKLLQDAQGLLPGDDATQLQREWKGVVQELLGAINEGNNGRGYSLEVVSWVDLVRRSASVFFATSTSSDLARLADESMRFDWVILEEAGRAHGFEMVIPLQLGYRYLLIGDQDQLEPHRIKEFERASQHLDEVFSRLSMLAKRDSSIVELVDGSLLSSYRNRRAEIDASRSNDRDMLLAETRRHLRFFKTLYEACRDESRTRKQNDPDAVDSAMMLSVQHRMHPLLGEMISRAFYQRVLSSATGTLDTPMPQVVHGFSRLAERNIEKRPLLFVDVPRLASGQFRKSGNGYALAYAEVDAVCEVMDKLDLMGRVPSNLAVLTPYRRQVALLRDRIQKSEGADKVVHTVDSFQGNQADVVIVSLVRNNREREWSKMLGFLREKQRTNVLLSRAKKLLILVGCWDFFFDVAKAEQSFRPEDQTWAKIIPFLAQHALRLRAESL